MWEDEIQSIEARHLRDSIRGTCIVFTGSSTIRLWETLQDDMPFSTILNHGFGGSQMADLAHYADRLIVPYNPLLTVVYSGDNDLAHNQAPSDVLEQAQHVVQKVRQHQAEAAFAFISVKPSPSRTGLIPAMKETNQLLQKWAAEESHLWFLDIFDAMLDVQGNPEPSLFIEDNLHMSPKGYALWSSILAPQIRSIFTVQS